MKAKECPICGSRKLKYVYYAPSEKDAPELWDDMVDTGHSPWMLFKRIECEKCGASVPGLSMTLDEAVSYWNDINENTNYRHVLQKIGEEPVMDVEGECDAHE